MKFLQFRKKNTDLSQVEQALEELLVPVTPSKKFIDGLGKQLRAASTAPQITIADTQSSSPEKLTLISLASIFSVLMLAAASVRTIVAILGTIGLINELGKHMKAKKAEATVHPV